jgi:hypothetical protein
VVRQDWGWLDRVGLALVSSVQLILICVRNQVISATQAYVYDTGDDIDVYIIQHKF